MSALWFCFRAEVLKLRRTLALWMAFVAPLVVVVMNLLLYLQRAALNFPDGRGVWVHYSENSLAFWCLLMMPLFITLETALIASIEHGEKHWKHLFALPVPRLSIYLAKWLVVTFLLALASAVFYAAFLASGWLLSLLRPGVYFGPAPLLDLLGSVVGAAVAALLLVSIHTFVSLRWQSFAFASGLGITVTVVNLFVASSESWSKVYPWALPAFVLMPETGYLPVALTIGALGGLVALVLGGWVMTRHEVS